MSNLQMFFLGTMTAWPALTVLAWLLWRAPTGEPGENLKWRAPLVDK